MICNVFFIPLDDTVVRRLLICYLPLNTFGWGQEKGRYLLKQNKSHVGVQNKARNFKDKSQRNRKNYKVVQKAATAEFFCIFIAS